MVVIKVAIISDIHGNSIALGPNLTIRFEATTNERIEEIKNEFLEVIEKNR